MANYNELVSHLQKGELMTKSDENTNENQKSGILGWWNKQSKNSQALLGAGGCCIGIFVVMIVMTLLFPVTALSVEPTQVQIDNQTTEYTIKGESEPNATVKITAPLLNLREKTIAVDSDGKFSYNLSIPINVTETNINITAKSPKKSQNGEKINIQRPITPLTFNPVNISSSATSLVIKGKTDPNASILINSKDLNLTNVQLIADEKGNFNITVAVPTNLKEMEVEGKANATGKRTNTQKITIKREEPAPAATSKSNLPTYTVANSKFQLSEDWKKTDDIKEENMIKFFYGNDLSLIVEQFSDENQYNSDYNANSKTGYGYTVKKETKKINNTSVKVVKITYDTDSSVIESYYFQKGGKYFIIAFEYIGSQYGDVIEGALNSVINTLN